MLYVHCAVRGVVLPLCLALLLVMPALAQPDADVREVQNYRLTLTGLNQFVAATRNLAAAMKADPRFAGMQKLQAEIEALQEKDELTVADEARLEKLEQELDTVQDAMPNLADANQSLSDIEAAIAREPLIAKALKSAGMSPRDYAKFALAFFQAAMVHGMQQAGMVKEVPKDAAINMENVKFVADHQKEIAAVTAELQALAKERQQ